MPASYFQSASQALGIVAPSASRTSAAGQLGMGGLGEKLQEQVAGETDEQRRKRMRDQMQTGFGGLAAQDLFGGGLGGAGGLSY